IIVVDYDCPDDTEDYIRRNRDKMLERSAASAIHVVKLHDKPRFNLCEARNAGIDSSQSHLILMLDADVFITDKNILRYIARRYEEGIVFFSNVAVLSTRYSEGVNFYKLKYGIKEIAFHALLPTHCKTVDLSGTACFLKQLYIDCGKYRPEVNRGGWGSHDIEFYLRYLNRYFYKVLLKQNTGGRTHLPEAMDKALRKVDSLPLDALEPAENTLEEKSRYYANPKNVSMLINKDFIRNTLEREGGAYGWSKRDAADDGTIAILKYNRYRNFPIPPWFRFYYYFWMGKKYLENVDCLQAIRHFKEVLKCKNVEVDYLLRSYFLLGDACKKQGVRSWKYYYRKGLDVFTHMPVTTWSDMYAAASLFKRLGRFDEAVPLFQQLIGEKANRDTGVTAGCCFHMGEIFYVQHHRERAMGMFKKTLELMPYHKKAARYLENG
ncbi:MAG: glycosyltransferase family 2 protein, partial [bacterium]|nr:glycosyltransferase family 2 protein [bacterium]